ncbi:hypothetical protein L6164_011699 [Bauhinia variegata]|uniref:Uncharacterized protein n=1 Tax=Bauhinia variegata TaxID=167791 RepID=A0ACB9P7M5_BAUVA|nr:hypothetical protein L6164_011699 [Bauhinia variegata]
MEAHKERKEQVKREEEEMRKGSGNKIIVGEENKSGMDPVAKRIIRDSIISDDSGNQRARAADDVLAFSRSVNKVDSSME